MTYCTSLPNTLILRILDKTHLWCAIMSNIGTTLFILPTKRFYGRTPNHQTT